MALPGQINVPGAGVSNATQVFAQQGNNTPIFAQLSPGGQAGDLAYTSDLGLCSWNGTAWSAISSTAFVPAALTSAGISAAALAAFNAGGGTVKLPAKTINLTSSLPLYSGVTYEGSGALDYTFSSAYTDIGVNYVGAGGTWLVGDGTFAIFSGNAVDQSSNNYASDTAIGQGSIVGGGVLNVGMANCTYGIKSGGVYQMGSIYGQFKNLAVINAQNFSYYFENFQHCIFDGIWSYYAGKGGVWLQASMSSTAGGTQFNPGNSDFRHIYVEKGPAPGANFGRGIVLRGKFSNGNSVLNQIVMSNIQSEGYGVTTYTQAATMAASSTSIGVTDGTKFGVEMPVMFTGNVNGFVQYQVYFVLSVSGNTITVGNSITGSAIASTGSTAVNIVTSGYPGLEIIGENPTNSQMQPVNVYGADIEGSTIAAINLTNVNGFIIDGNFLPIGAPQNYTQTWVLRNANFGSIRSYGPTAGESSIDMDSGSRQTNFAGVRQRNSWLGQGNPYIGEGLWASNEPTTTNNIGGSTSVISLRGQYSPEIYASAGGSIHLASLEGGIRQIASGVTIGTTGDAISFVYTGAAGGTLTLPTISSTNGSANVGLILFVTNPSNGNLTVNTNGTQTINGASGVFSQVLPANSSGMFVASNNAGTLFWAFR